MIVRDTVCFDLDGTLLEPGGSIRKSIDHAVSSEGLRSFAPEEVLIGMPLRDILRTRTTDAVAIDRMVAAFRAYYISDAWRFVQWYPGVQDMLAACRDHGLQTAIVTTKGEEEAEHLMRSLGASHLFDTIIGDDDVRALKPHPDPVIAACGRLGRHPRDAIMVGDTSFDVDAGKAAGCHTIGVRWGSGWQWGAAPDQAHELVDDAPALWQAIRTWHQG